MLIMLKGLNKKNPKNIPKKSQKKPNPQLPTDPKEREKKKILNE